MKRSYLSTAEIINLLHEQYPERTEILDQFKDLEAKKWLKRNYIVVTPGYDKRNPVKESIVLKHSLEGSIVIDVLKDGNIKGIEMVGDAT